ncbi:hypothetical protein KI387_017317, partial [Taxus chinensis]
MEYDHGQTLKEMDSFVENVSKSLKDEEYIYLKHEEELKILKAELEDANNSLKIYEKIEKRDNEKASSNMKTCVKMTKETHKRWSKSVRKPNESRDERNFN